MVLIPGRFKDLLIKVQAPRGLKRYMLMKQQTLAMAADQTFENYRKLTRQSLRILDAIESAADPGRRRKTFFRLDITMMTTGLYQPRTPLLGKTCS